MALQLKLSRVGINSVGTEMYLSDVTGEYASGTNEGGWGSPNASRTDKALLVQAIQRTSTGNDSVLFSEYDPLTVVNFLLPTPIDGYYDIIMVAVDKVVPIVEGAYGWTVGSGLVQLVGGVLVSKVPEDLYKDELFLDAISFKTVLLARMSIYRNRKNLEFVQKKKAASDDKGHVREITELANNLEYIKALLEGAKYHWCSGLYSESQLLVESFNEIVANDGL